MKVQCIDTAMIPRLVWARGAWNFSLAVLVAMAIAQAAGQRLSRNVSQSPPPSVAASPSPAADALVTALKQGPKQPGGDTANPVPDTEIARDFANLLKLANDLKAAVDKSTKDTLSIPVVRKAGEIEKLARQLKEQEKTKRVAENR